MSIQDQRILKMSLCGGHAVGKSSIGSRIAKQEPYLDYNPTIGVDYFARRLPNYNAKISIWDLSGDRRFDTITAPYIKGTTIILYVYDITRYESVMELDRLHILYKGVSNLNNVKIIVVGNKTDKVSCLYNCVIFGKIFAEKLQVPHIEVSAKTNEGMDELLSLIIQETNLEKITIIPNTDTNTDLLRTCRDCCVVS